MADITKKTYLIDDCNKSLLDDYIEIEAKSPKLAAEKYLSKKVSKIFLSEKGKAYDITVQEGSIIEGEVCIKWGSPLYLYVWRAL